MVVNISSLVQNLSSISSEPKEEAKIILAKLLNKQPTEILDFESIILNKKQSSQINEIIAQRLTGRPLQYVLNEAWFYGHKFYVNERVLIPRPETERLVELTLDFLLREERSGVEKTVSGSESVFSTGSNKKIVVADIGTGSGCVVISLALEIRRRIPLVIYATDASADALEVARLNAEFLVRAQRQWSREQRSRSRLLDRLDGEKTAPVPEIQFLHGSLLEPLPEPANIIVANLPYIPTDRISHLQTEVKDWEPHVALDGGEDGFDLYRELFRQMAGNVANGPKPLQGSSVNATIARTGRHSQNYCFWQSPGLLLAEIDYTHRDMAVNVLKEYLPETKAELIFDPMLKQYFLQAEI